MKTNEFILLCASYCAKTSNVRICSAEKAVMGVHLVPIGIAQRIGAIVALIQAKIDQGHFCKKKDEYLLIYNFQPLAVASDVPYYSLQMVIKPLSKIEDVVPNSGTPFQMVIHGHTADVMNISYVLLQLGLTTLDDLKKEGKPPPEIYGKAFLIYHKRFSFFATDEKGLTPSQNKKLEKFRKARHHLLNVQTLAILLGETADSQDEKALLKYKELMNSNDFNEEEMGDDTCFSLGCS